MKNIIKITAILLILAGSLSCDKEDDIDMSKIDFSNIENLYEQPLPVIQKAVQGKWKVYSSCGGFAGCSYPKDCFREQSNNQTVSNDELGNIYTHFFSWKKKQVNVDGNIVNTYVMWSDDADETVQSATYFISIKNDTLYSQNCSLTSYYIFMSNTYIRVK
jgi:hypothetical protein